MSLVNRSDEVLSKVLGHYTQLEVERGEGAYLYGADGKAYLDFASGIAVTNTGHCHPQVVAAAVEQTKKLIHNCAGVTYTAANIEFAEALKQVVPIKDARFFLCQSGSEAIEGALKAAKYVSGKSGIIALKNGFHGRTMGALSVTSSKDSYLKGYGALMPQSFVAEHNIAAIDNLNNGNIAAIITELVQGEAGYVAHDVDFIKELRQYCDDKGIFLIIDEVQTGFGRTGKLFACQHYGLEPDIMALSKAIASGFPLGAVVMKPAISNSWTTSAHGGTFTGNLVSCAAATATLAVLQQELPAMAGKIELVQGRVNGLLQSFPQLFTQNNGLGFMVGLKCASADICTKIRTLALAKQLLLINSDPQGATIRFAYPVVISLADLAKGFDIIEEVCKEIINA